MEISPKRIEKFASFDDKSSENTFPFLQGAETFPSTTEIVSEFEKISSKLPSLLIENIQESLFGSSSPRGSLAKQQNGGALPIEKILAIDRICIEIWQDAWALANQMFQRFVRDVFAITKLPESPAVQMYELFNFFFW